MKKKLPFLPEDLKSVKHCEQLYFESGYGKDFLIEDACYETYGCQYRKLKRKLYKKISYVIPKLEMLLI